MLPEFSDLDQLYIALGDFEYFSRPHQASAGAILMRLGATKAQADALDQALAEMDQASANVIYTPSPSQREDWDRAEERLKAILTAILGKDGYDYSECSLCFPAEEWEEQMRLKCEEPYCKSVNEP